MSELYQESVLRMRELINTNFEGLICKDDAKIIFKLWHELFLPFELRSEWNLLMYLTEENASIYLSKRGFVTPNNNWIVKY